VALLLWPRSGQHAPSEAELAALIADLDRPVPSSGAPLHPSPARSDVRSAAVSLSPAELRMTVDGPSATVWLDGEAAGVTPFLDTGVRAGARTVRVSRAGTTILDTTLYVRSGALIHFHVVDRSDSAAPSAPADRQPAARQRPPARQRAAPPPPSPRSTPNATRPRVGW